MSSREEERLGLVFADVFPADVPSARLEQRLQAIGRRRKRFLGGARSPCRTGARVALGVGVPLALGVGVLATLLPAEAGALRWLLAAVSVVTLALTIALPWWLRGKHLRHQAEHAPAFDFHEGGGVYRESRRLHVFTWTMVGRVVFAPNSNPGAVSELILSLAPEEPMRGGEAVTLQTLRNALILTSDFFALDDLHKMGRRLHTLLGHLKVVSHPRDRKLYRLD